MPGEDTFTNLTGQVTAQGSLLSDAILFLAAIIAGVVILSVGFVLVRFLR